MLLRRTFVALLVLTATVALPASIQPVEATPEQSRACQPPYLPLVEAFSQPSGGPADPVPNIPGTDVVTDQGDGLPVVFRRLDSDGDGEPDMIATNRTSTVITRGDGSITFTQPGRSITLVSVGDLDGDGRDDFAVNSFALSAPRDAGRGWVISGAITPGTYDPASVGVAVGGPILVAIPDRNGDGVVELATNDARDQQLGTTRILSGRAIIATPAPSDGTDLVPLVQIPGRLFGFAALGGPATLISTDSSSGPAIHLVDEAQDLVFGFRPGTYRPNYAGVGEIRVLVSDQGTFLVLVNGSRSGGSTYIWRVDEPCGSLPKDPTTPSQVVEPAPGAATPASAMTSNASYTG